MICRIWHGWAVPANADAYEGLLRATILPGIRSRDIPGYLGAQLLRQSLEREVEFVTLLWFSSWEAVSDFAGEDWERAVVPNQARALLARYDERASHYETVVDLIL